MQTLTVKPYAQPPERPATLADVAREAGVSVATVSRVLNSKLAVPITPETEQRIRDAAERLMYRPNAIARALATRRTYTAALFTQEMTDPHFAQMLGPVEDELRKRGYRLAVCTDAEGLLSEGRVDGAILLADPTNEAQGFGRLPIPTVFVWSARVPLPNCVTWDDVAGAALAVGHLAAHGHRAIVGLFGDYPDDGTTPDKVAGYRAAISAVPGSAGPIEWRGQLSSDQFENGFLLTRQALEAGREWTAIFARNDFLALGALRALRHAGIKVPDEVSIVGYNDTVIARIADPAMSSVLTPIAEAGALAAASLVDAIERRSHAVSGITLPVRLTERKSCAAPAHRG
ncbi:MAG: LacI family transcriptional regulator [Chthonomonadales bacterium]|nr:LacI family transcriptional regulator [Chthonomonadales bacterium]